MGHDHPGHVADDDGCHLDVGDWVGAEEPEVDPPSGGAEQVPAKPEGIAAEGDGGLPAPTCTPWVAISVAATQAEAPVFPV